MEGEWAGTGFPGIPACLMLGSDEGESVDDSAFAVAGMDLMRRMAVAARRRSVTVVALLSNSRRVSRA